MKVAHSEEEREQVQRFISDNDDLFTLLIKRLEKCLREGDARTISFFACQLGQIMTVALNLMAAITKAENEIPNA
jgi:hypothetical protein